MGRYTSSTARNTGTPQSMVNTVGKTKSGVVVCERNSVAEIQPKRIVGGFKQCNGVDRLNAVGSDIGHDKNWSQ